MRVSLAILLSSALLLSACAGMNRSADGASSNPAENDVAVYTDLIKRMIQSGQYYAALAHIQERQRAGNNDQLRFLEAEARRNLGQTTAAETLYRGLLNGPLSAGAYHGLGLLYATRNMNTAISYLREAAKRAPADADLRNDLGYALMRAGRYQEALPELATAVELDPNNDQPRNNLLLMMFLRNDEKAAQKIIRDGAVPADTVTRLRAQALALQPRPPAGTGVRK